MIIFSRLLETLAQPGGLVGRPLVLLVDLPRDDEDRKLKVPRADVTNLRTWIRMKPEEELMKYFCMKNNKDLLDGHLDHVRDATYRKYFGID